VKPLNCEPMRCWINAWSNFKTIVCCSCYAKDYICNADICWTFLTTDEVMLFTNGLYDYCY